MGPDRQGGNRHRRRRAWVTASATAARRAILLARAGAHVLVVDRDLGLAERTVAMIAAEGGSAAAASYDVTVSAQCAAMVDDAVSRWGRLDCLDNNVGIGSRGASSRRPRKTGRA